MAEFEDAYFLICCRYCGEEYPAISLDDHEDICGDLIKYVSSGVELGNPKPVEIQDSVGGQMDEESCNICGNFFPKMLMQQHKVVCEALLENYNFAIDMESGKNATQNKDNEKAAKNEHQNEPKTEPVEMQIKSLPTKSKENVQMSSIPDPKENSNKKELVDAQETKKETGTELKKKSKLLESKKAQAEEAKNLKNKSGNLFSTDFDTGYSKNFKSEKPTKKTQKYPPIECEEVEESTDNLDYESDDDCEESLEEFWTKAREILKRRTMVNIH